MAKEDPKGVQLVLTCQFDARTAYEVELKGWFGQAVAELPSGVQVRLTFWDPVRLAQDLESDIKQGRHCLATPGMVVVPRVTLEFMERAVEELSRQGYFEDLLATGRNEHPAEDGTEGFF